MTQLTISKPVAGWATLKLDDDRYYLSYNTNVAYDILKAAYDNYVLYSAPIITTFDSEGDGCFYMIFDHQCISICWCDDNYAKHYYLCSAKEILRQLYAAIKPYENEWCTFTVDGGYEYMIDFLPCLLKHIEENCPEVTK